MRVRALLAGAAVAVTGVLPAAPASAACAPVVSWLRRQCFDGCVEAQRAVRAPAGGPVLGDHVPTIPCPV